MKAAACLSVLICLLLLLNGAPAADAKKKKKHHSPWTFRDPYSLFIFGDSFADTGNVPKGDDLTRGSRMWYAPYAATRPLFKGRFSDGFVQTDVAVRIVVGRNQTAPSTYRVAKRIGDPAGMNFAHSGSGVLDVPDKRPTLAKQIQFFRELTESGVINAYQLNSSVALVAVSGNDYARVASGHATDDHYKDQMVALIVGKVTDGIARGVKQLRKLGVAKVLVNNMHPLGCVPWQTRAANYTACAALGNAGAALHNSELKRKLSAYGKDVYVVDLNAAFSSILKQADPSGASPEAAHDFTNSKMKPCCKTFDPNGFCGQVGKDGKPKYSVCDDPESHFFWDDEHPTEAGWKAVMAQLQDGINEFLGISN